MTENVVDFEARNRLRMIVNRTAELRPLKSVSAKAISMAEDERSAAMDLAAVISSDQALTARLLRLSNSAYYGYARRISNVREAVILLGMRTVRSVAITSGIIDSFRESDSGDFDMDLFWAHSVTVGIVAETIAKDTRLARPEDAFTAGVMHDVGKLAMFLCEPDAMAEVTGRVIKGGLRWRDAEIAVFGLTHEHTGSRLAQKWKFPDPLVDAIQQHHATGRGGSVDSLADIVRLANLACNKNGLAAGLDWTRNPERKPVEAIPPRAEEAIKRVHGGMATLEEKARAFLAQVTSRPPRWYLGPQVLVEPSDGEENTNAA